MAIDSFRGEYRFLSNFWLAEIDIDGVRYQTTEHYYQAEKALHQSDRFAIMIADTPALAKRRARAIEKRPDVNERKLEVMTIAVTAKFTQHPDLADKLLATGDQELIEGNTWGDIYWGVCRGQGENNLGKILMGVRAAHRNTAEFQK